MDKLVFADPQSVHRLVFKSQDVSGARAWAKAAGFLKTTPVQKQADGSLVIEQRKPDLFVDGSFVTRSFSDGVEAVLGTLVAKMTPAEEEWETDRHAFLVAKGRFNVQKHDGRVFLRFSAAPPEGGQWSISFEEDADETEREVAFVGRGPETWLNVKKGAERAGFTSIDSGEYEMEWAQKGRVEMELRGETFSGRYMLARRGLAWTLAGPLGASFKVTKSNDAKRYTLGVAYPVGQVDVHGDMITAPELEAAAWEYVSRAGGRRIGLLHKSGTEGAGTVVESYIYRGPDWQVGDQVVKEGDWLLGVVWSEGAWKEIKKGNLTGYSIQGWALRSKV